MEYSVYSKRYGASMMKKEKKRLFSTSSHFSFEMNFPFTKQEKMA